MGKLFMVYVHSGRMCKTLKGRTEMIFITWEKVCALMLIIKKKDKKFWDDIERGNYTKR